MLFLHLVLIPLSSPHTFASPTLDHMSAFEASAGESETMVSSQPMYVKLQAQEDANVTLWESIPQNFSDHVATIMVDALAIFVSSNAQKVNLYKDEVGNLWLTANYSLKKGDYVNTLAWTSSVTLSQNLTIPVSSSFPTDYPEDVKPFLLPGRKIPADDAKIKQLAESLWNQSMIQTVENILNYVNATQIYDADKVRALMNGTLSTPNILDFISDPLESLSGGRSFCFERSLLAAAMLRADGIPARTYTNADLKTWIQVWLPQLGWVDGDVLSTQPQPLPLFPRSLAVSVPRMVENSSDATFPFSWLPNAMMRVANLTLTSVEEFDVNQYGTVLCQPVDAVSYGSNPDGFSFPIIFEPETVQTGLTYNGSELSFHISKGEENASKKINLGSLNSMDFAGLSISFTPILQSNGMIALTDFSALKTQEFDYRILIPFLVAVPIILVFTYYRRRNRTKH
jgi:hypothetical protein